MINSNKRQLPQMLLRLRKSKGLNQQDVAGVLGISKAHYCRIESGERLVQDNHLILLSELYKYDLELLRSMYLADKLIIETENFTKSEVESAIKILIGR